LFKIASAMIDRAEFPVQRNRTLNGRSVISVPSVVCAMLSVGSADIALDGPDSSGR
jgi:hypothetical protein